MQILKAKRRHSICMILIFCLSLDALSCFIEQTIYLPDSENSKSFTIHYRESLQYNIYCPLINWFIQDAERL